MSKTKTKVPYAIDIMAENINGLKKNTKKLLKLTKKRLKLQRKINSENNNNNIQSKLSKTEFKIALLKTHIKNTTEEIIKD